MKISYDRLFDFSNPKDLEQAIQNITQLGTVYEKLISEVSKNKGRFAGSMQEITKATQQAVKDQNSFNIATEKGRTSSLEQAKAVEAQFQAFNTLNTSLKQADQTLNKLTKEQADFNAKAKETIKLQTEMEKLEAKLATLNTQEAAAVAKLKLEIQQKNKALQQSSKEALGLVSVYDKELARLTDLAKRYKDYVVSGKEATKAARDLKKEHDALRATIIRADQSVGQFNKNVGNYRSAISGVTNATRQFFAAFGIVGGVTMFAYLIRDTFALIKESESLNKALKQVTETSSNYARQIEYLRDLSDRYGININLLTESYTKFFVATKGTRLEGEQTQRIFTSVTKSLAVMGASTQDTERALKALGQMISKGKIQAEELRGQLGDALPGAFAIMAKALGVTTAQLDKMLKDGKLLADEVLPKFAVELEKSFGVENLQRIDTLRGAQTRLTNAWIEFVKSVEDGEGVISKSLIGIMESFSSLLTLITPKKNLLDTITNREKLQEMRESIQKMKEIREELQKSGDITLKDPQKSPWRFILGYDGADAVINRGYNRLQDINKEIKNLEKSITAMVGETPDWLIEAEAETRYNKALKEGINTYEDFEVKASSAIQNTTDKTRILAAVNRLYTKNAAKGVEELTDEQKKLNKAYQDSIKLAKGYEDELDRLLGDEVGKKRKIDPETGKVIGDPLIFLDPDVKDFSDEVYKGLDDLNKGIEERINKEYEVGVGKQIEDSVQSATNSAYGWYERMVKNMTDSRWFVLFKNFWDKWGDTIQAAIQKATDTINQFFTNQSIKRENNFTRFEEDQNKQIERLEADKERELSVERLTTEQKQAINRRYESAINQIEDNIERKRRQIRRREAQAAKAQALFNAIINTAVAVTSALGNPILAAIIGGLGATQIALIASQPLPAYAEGTPPEGHGGGKAWVGEKGREMVITPDGQVSFTPNKKTLVDLPEGSHVLTNVVTKRILENGPEKELSASSLSNQQVEQVIKIIRNDEDYEYLADRFDRSLKRLPIQYLNLGDKGHFAKSMKKGGMIIDKVRQKNKY